MRSKLTDSKAESVIQAGRGAISMKNLLGGNVLALIVITSLAATGPNQGIKHSLLCILLYTLTSQFVLICELVPYVDIA